MAGDALLRQALEAHGGEHRWRAVEQLVARVRSGGFALASRGRPRAFRAYEATITTGRPRVVITPYPAPGRRGVFEGDTVRIETADGRLVAARAGARLAFRRFRRQLWWDRLDALYFAGYALWNYFTTPFLFTRPGFALREGEPWSEAGRTWRRLHVTFPPDVPTHCPEQVFYFDAGGVLQRLDYTAEVFGRWARAAHYCAGHRAFDGLLVPTRRRVHPRAASGRPRPFPTLVWIEVDDVRVITGRR